EGRDEPAIAAPRVLPADRSIRIELAGNGRQLQLAQKGIVAQHAAQDARGSVLREQRVVDEQHVAGRSFGARRQQALQAFEEPREVEQGVAARRRVEAELVQARWKFLRAVADQYTAQSDAMALRDALQAGDKTIGR